MAEIGSWNGHTFTVSPTLIRSFTGLTIKGSSETTNKTSSSQQYVKRKSGNPSEITLNVGLSAFTGCNVKDEALAFVDEAHSGAKSYFYINGKKLLPCQLMLVEASVTETEIAAGGTWTKCQVKLTMKQCSKYDGTGGGGSDKKKSSGSKKKTTKKTSTKTTSVVSKVVSTVKNAVKTAANAVKNVVSKVSKVASAVKKINQVVTNAKKASASTKKKTTTIKKKVTTTSKKIKRATK